MAMTYLVSYAFDGGYGCEWCVFDHVPSIDNIDDRNNAINQILNSPKYKHNKPHDIYIVTFY